MKMDSEKPLTLVRGKPLIQYVLEALRDSTHIDRIIIATSPHTPETAKFVKNIILNGIDVSVLITPGVGYIEDLSFALSQDDLANEIILTITSDLPLITGMIIDQVLHEYQKSPKPAMSCGASRDIL